METTFTWYSPHYEWRERSADWFWWVGTLALIGIGLSVWFKNYLLAALLFLGGGLLILFARREPDEYVISVNQEGITIDERKFLFRDLDAFWIADPTAQGVFHKLMLHTQSGPVQMHTYLIDIDVDVEALREFLRSKLTETEFKPSRIEVEFEKFLG